VAGLVDEAGFCNVARTIVCHLSGEMMLVKRELPIAASSRTITGWHPSMLSLGAVVTGSNAWTFRACGNAMRQ